MSTVVVTVGTRGWLPHFSVSEESDSELEAAPMCTDSARPDTVTSMSLDVDVLAASSKGLESSVSLEFYRLAVLLKCFEVDVLAIRF